MLQPNPGMLLKTLRTGLKAKVLPALDRDSAAGRQLRASLYLIGRLEQSWDLYHQHLRKDNQDLEDTLRSILGKLISSDSEGDFEQLLEELETTSSDDSELEGLNDPALITATRANLILQDIASRLQMQLSPVAGLTGIARECAESLANLYRRMSDRDLIYVGEKPTKK